MISTSAISLKSQIARMLWLGNAVTGAFIVLLGTGTAFGMFSYDSQLSPLIARFGVVLAVTGTALAVFSLWRFRSISAAR